MPLKTSYKVLELGFVMCFYCNILGEIVTKSGTVVALGQWCEYLQVGQNWQVSEHMIGHSATRQARYV